MNFNENTSYLKHSRDMVYKLFKRVLYKLVVQCEKDEVIEPRNDPVELFQSIKMQSMKRHNLCEFVVEKEYMLMITKSWKIKKYSEQSMLILTNQFVNEVNQLNGLRKKYMTEYLKLLPDGKEKCRKWSKIIKEEEEEKQSFRKEVNKVIAYYKEE